MRGAADGCRREGPPSHTLLKWPDRDGAGVLSEWLSFTNTDDRLVLILLQEVRGAFRDRAPLITLSRLFLSTAEPMLGQNTAP